MMVSQSGRNVLLSVFFLAAFIFCLVVYCRRADNSSWDDLGSFENRDSSGNGSGGVHVAGSTRLIGRPFSTSDEMMYIMFGEGNEAKKMKSGRNFLDFIRLHVSRQSPTRPRKLADRSSNTDFSQAGQSKFVDRLLQGRRGGFFVECGAVDGEGLSNSLFFELERSWTGLLIEANPQYHGKLLKLNRNALVLRACLSTKPHPMTVNMRPAGVLGGIVDNMHKSHLKYISNFKGHDVQVNCFPLNSIMDAIGRMRVDFFSLDVEGPELEILKTIDFRRLQIDVFTIEYRIYGGGQIGIDRQATLDKLSSLRRFFNATKMYKEVGLLPLGTAETGGLDVVFQRVI